ncbi:DUF4091 domain-containing protein [Caldicellulosiruptoraceae bacterium PP1]
MIFEIKSSNEWLFPDSKVDITGNKSIRLTSARGGYTSCQILLNNVEINKEVQIKITSPKHINYEIYRLIDVLVEKNTGPIGFCLQEGELCEGYTTRKAPFRVFDALKPFEENEYTNKETEAFYIAFKINKELCEGIYEFDVCIKLGDEIEKIPVSIKVFDVIIPENENLYISNWFNIENMATQHNLEIWSEEHWKMIKLYGLLMRRVRQTHFWVSIDLTIVKKDANGRYIFDFSRTKRFIELYLGLGFKYIEGGPIAFRKNFKDSYFVVNCCGNIVNALTDEGYDFISQFLIAWKNFLKENGWYNITVQHVADEPTEACSTEYRVLSGIVRKFLPGIKIIEAVEYYDLDGAVDIWIPKNVYYQENIVEFERKRQNGDELWFYTCCLPGGYYLNRLLDMPLIRTRYLHWGNFKYKLSGYLHWGLNFCDNNQDPFNQKDIFFPPGDTHITYPGNGKPWGSMRLEAMRSGIEDFEILKILERKNSSLAKDIVDYCIKSFDNVNENIEQFENIRNMLLSAASEKFNTKLVSSLVKVFPDKEPDEEFIKASALKGEVFNFQVAYKSNSLMKNITILVESDLREYISIYNVGLVPSELPCYSDHDDFILRSTPGLYPDPLYPIERYISVPPNQWRAIWVSINIPKELNPGIHKVKLIFYDEQNNFLNSCSFELEIIDKILPEQKIIHTEWFYLDCLATWYNVDIFSEEHFEIIEKYIECYVEHGMNMILTPLFTPPLETEIGHERPTVQLVKIKKIGNQYIFNFSLLEKWINLCREKGIKYFEFSHLFTQWGAKHAPKIIAEVNGKEEKIFGWETDANSNEYSQFLGQFLDELSKFIYAHNLENSVYFHISDEPGLYNINEYENARKLINSRFPIIEALSDYEFYKKGLVDIPVVSTEHINKFIENNVENIWAYYCCCEYKKLSNRFFNMPSLRTRILGFQLYKYGIKGFLHWGFNHWYSQKSLYEIDPFKVTDAGLAFPSGDAFLVYPGANKPIGSIRLKIMLEVMQDIRACELLEKIKERNFVMDILEKNGEITFTEYPKDNNWFIETRNLIYNALKNAIK